MNREIVEYLHNVIEANTSERQCRKHPEVPFFIVETIIHCTNGTLKILARQIERGDYSLESLGLSIREKAYQAPKFNLPILEHLLGLIIGLGVYIVGTILHDPFYKGWMEACGSLTSGAFGIPLVTESLRYWRQRQRERLSPGIASQIEDVERSHGSDH